MYMYSECIHMYTCTVHVQHIPFCSLLIELGLQLTTCQVVVIGMLSANN